MTPGRIWTLPPTCAVAAGILPAVEPGILPGEMAVPQARGAPPGGRMPPAGVWTFWTSQPEGLLEGSRRSPRFWEATSGQRRRRCPAPRQGCQTRHCRRRSRLALPRPIGLAPFCNGFHLLQPALPLGLFHERTPPLYPAGLEPAPPRIPRRHHPWTGGCAAQAWRSRGSCPRPHWA